MTLRSSVVTFLVFVSPMLANTILAPIGADDTVGSYLGWLSLAAFSIAAIQAIVALFQLSLLKIATGALIIIAHIGLLTSETVGHLQSLRYLYLHQAYYQQAVAAKRSQPDYPGFVIFEVGSSFTAMEDIIYDETDSLATYPLPATSPLLSESIFVDCRYSAEYLFDHFYSVDIGC